MIALLLVLGSTAVAAFTRLVVNDTILDQPRRWVNLHAPRFIVKLLGCPWCISAWLSAATVGVLMGFGSSMPLPLLWWPALWRLGLILYWLTEALARFGVDEPIEYRVVDDEPDSIASSEVRL